MSNDKVEQNLHIFPMSMVLPTLRIYCVNLWTVTSSVATCRIKFFISKCGSNVILLYRKAVEIIQSSLIWMKILYVLFPSWIIRALFIEYNNFPHGCLIFLICVDSPVCPRSL